MHYNSEESTIGLIEVPDEISLCLVIQGCPLNCEGCHSTHNKTDRDKELTLEELKKLVLKYKNKISCICFLGGEWESENLIIFLKYIKSQNIKTCLYTGLDFFDDKNIIKYLDFLKVGSYKEEFGGLSEKTTNQRFYKIVDFQRFDITEKFFKKEIK